MMGTLLLSLFKHLLSDSRSWQVIQFDPVAVTFVKIVGTSNSANEVTKMVDQ